MDRYVVEVFVTAVDEQGDELEIVTVKSPMLALHDKERALLLASGLSGLARDLIRSFPSNYQVSAQYPSIG